MTGGAMKLRIIIVEDETLIRKGIRKKTENLGAEVVFDTDSGYRDRKSVV